MNRNTKITLYEIERCGYYAHGDQQPSFGDLSSTLAELKSWIAQDDFTVRKTRTFDQPLGSDQLPVYCYGLYPEPNTGDYLLITWNETETVEGKFAGLFADGPTGNAEVSASAVPDDTIPGFPTYFWFIPEHGLVAAIQFDNRLNGHQGMNFYLRGFLERFSRWTHTKNGQEGGLDFEVIGYSEEQNGEITNKVKPQFRSKLCRNPGLIDFIKKNQEDISKIVRKNKYRGGAGIGEGAERSVVKTLLSLLGFENDPVPVPDMRYRYEIAYTPDKDELNEIIDSWDPNRAASWNDIGFQFRGKSKTHWLGQSVASDVLSLDVDLKNPVLFDEHSIICEIINQRNTIIALRK